MTQEIAIVGQVIAGLVLLVAAALYALSVWGRR
jgi:hypothetical protein